MRRQQQIHSTNHRFRRDLAHWQAWPNVRKLGQRTGRLPVQNQCRTFQRSPVKRIRWTEKDHLRGVCRGCEMHRSRIDRNKEARLIDQRGQGEQICFSGKIDGRLLQCTLDLTKMFLFGLRGASCKHGANARVGPSVIDYIGPTLRFPEFLQTGGPRMKNDIRFADLRIPQKRSRFSACCLWQFQAKRAGRIADSDRPK